MRPRVIQPISTAGMAPAKLVTSHMVWLIGYVTLSVTPRPSLQRSARMLPSGVIHPAARIVRSNPTEREDQILWCSSHQFWQCQHVEGESLRPND